MVCGETEHNGREKGCDGGEQSSSHRQEAGKDRQEEAGHKEYLSRLCSNGLLPL